MPRRPRKRTGSVLEVYIKKQNVHRVTVTVEYESKSKEKGWNPFHSYLERDRLVRELGFKSYGAYLSSPLWRITRRKALSRNPRCLLCGHLAEVVHHVSYALEVLQGHSLDDLVSLCHFCHDRIEHTKSGKKRTLENANLALYAQITKLIRESK